MTGWTAIIPIKPWRLAKSRLDHPRRELLAQAFSFDTIETVTATESIARVVIVSAEVRLAALARRHGATLLRDQPLLPGRGLDVAVDIGRRWAAHRSPSDPVVVVPGDLPALRSEHLEHALAHLLGTHRSFVPDRLGTGTTVLTARSPWQLLTSYGPDSARRHRSLGLTQVTDVAAGLRFDVDSVADLRAASVLGVGPHTIAALSGVDRGARRAARLST